jgi:multicomponent Na+:H+ antiporter subunit G
MISDTIVQILIYVCIGISLFFNALGVIGILRFPDFYTRLHPSTKCTTFGGIFACFAAIIFGIYLAVKGNSAMTVMAIHVGIVLICLLLTNPTGAHAIARAAHRSGIYPKTWGGKPVEVDVLYEEKEKLAGLDKKEGKE